MGDTKKDLAATLNALATGAAFSTADDETEREPTQVLDLRQQQELMALREQQSKKLRTLDKRIVVMFTDLVGSTQYYERYGDLKGREKVLTHNAVIFPIIQKYRGVIVKTIGDAILAYFESANDSVLSAWQIQRALQAYNQGIANADDQIHIRIALNAGVAIAQEGDIYGDVVNVAARIEKQTKADEVLMSASVTEALEGSWPIESVGAPVMKGKADRVALHRLRWSDVRQQETKKAPLPAHFSVKRVLARSSIGELYEVTDEQNHRDVCVKRLYDHLAEDTESRLAFVHAAREQAHLNIDGVVRVFNHSREDEVPAYYEAEIISGTDLGHFVSKNGPPSPQRAAEIVLNVCHIMAQAHAKNALHRGLGPDNVLMREDGQLCLTNFGMSNVTAAQVRRGNSPPGSLAFTAPEQLLGKAASPQSDVYSIGALLYFLLSGRDPIEDAASLEGTILSAQGAVVPLKRVCPHAPVPLIALVTKALSVAPSSRQPGVAGLISELQAYIGTKSRSAATIKTTAPARRKPRRAVLAVSGLIAGAGIGFLIGRVSIHEPPPIVIAQPASAPVAAASRPVEAAAPIKSALAARLEAAGVVEHGDQFALAEGQKTTLVWQRSARIPVDLGRLSAAATVFALARLVESGKLASLSEPLSTYFPEWQQGKKRQITLRHLLEHSTGLADAAQDDLQHPQNIVRYALAGDLIADPGKKRAFNGKAFNLLAGVVQSVSGKRMDHLFQEEVVTPLGLSEPRWSYDGDLTPISSAGLAWHAADLARLGAAALDGSDPFGPTWRDLMAEPLAGDANTTLVWHTRTLPDVGVVYDVTDPKGAFWLLVPSRRLVAARLTKAPIADPHGSIEATLKAMLTQPAAAASAPAASLPVVSVKAVPSSAPVVSRP